jgi:subtilisin family serine protease
MPLLRLPAPAWRAVAVTATTAVLAVAQALLAPLASADPQPEADDERSCTKSGESLRYVIVFDRGTPANEAKREIRKACGALSVYYDAIAVGIATADDEFGERIGVDRAFSAEAYRAADSGDAEQRVLPPTDAEALTRADRTDDQWGMQLIHADAARAVASGGDDVVVGVLDSGIDAAHPELRRAVDPAVSAGCLTGKPDTAKRAWAPTTSVHGTHVAGTIAAADDGAGIVGVAPDVRLASIKVIGDRGQVDPEAAVCGLMWAAKHHMPVTNSSFFVDSGASSCDSDDEHGVVREAISRAADYARDAGTLHVAAATNESVSLAPASGSTSADCEALPASLRSVVAVSAIDAEGVKAGYSSYGLGVISLAGPGGDGGECVLSTVPDGYNDTCGTSMAAPHVAGVAALLAARDPDAGPEQLRRTLQTTAQQTACPADYDRSGDGHQDAYCTGYRGYNSFYGHGVVDALAAVTSIATPVREPERSPKKQRPDPPRRGQDADRGQPDKHTDVPEHRGLEDAARQLTQQLNAVIQGR